MSVSECNDLARELSEYGIGGRTPQDGELSDWSMSERQQRKVARRLTAFLFAG